MGTEKMTSIDDPFVFFSRFGMRRIVAFTIRKIGSAASNDVSAIQRRRLEIIHDIFSKRFFFRTVVFPEHYFFRAMMGSKLHIPFKILVARSLFGYVEDLFDRRILAIAKEKHLT